MAEVPSTNEVSEAGSFVVLSGKTQDSWENLVSDSDSDDEDDVRSLLSDTEQTFERPTQGWKGVRKPEPVKIISLTHTPEHHRTSA